MYYTLSYQFFSPLVCLVNLLLLSRILENITVNAWSAGVSFGVNYKLRVFKDAKPIQEDDKDNFLFKDSRWDQTKKPCLVRRFLSLKQAECFVKPRVRYITSYVYESHSAALIATEYCAEEISGVSNRFATSPGGSSNNTAPLFPAISAHTSPSPRVLCSCIELCRTTKPDLDKTASRSLSKTWKFFETFAQKYMSRVRCTYSGWY